MKTSNVITGIACVSLPIGYLVKKHVDWERSPQSKKRMLTHHVTFWTSMAAGLVLIHQAFMLKKNLAFRTLKQTGMFLSGAVLPVIGFEGGERFARALFPHQKKPPSPFAALPKRYYPSYLVASSPGQTPGGVHF